MVWIILGIMALHGLIHLMGGLNELGLAKIQELSGETPPSIKTAAIVRAYECFR
ncbi:hypothetical protein PUR_08260 [Paenibacillus sp. URB8-2]|nr:hypothetical protein PUR_08260 [Paenibacillus sp. URB8-2]